MGVRGIDHVNLRAPAELIERLRRFYIDVIGLHEGPRPTPRSGVHGHWLYAGDQALVHLAIAADGDGQPQRTGWLSHVALACDDLESMRARLDTAVVAYRMEIVDSPSQVQLFLTDPAGVGVELNFRTDKR